MSEKLVMEVDIHEKEKHLFPSRPKENKNGALSPCDMTPDDVDYEMSFPKDKRILQISGMNQESFEYFVEKYGQTYEVLIFFKCQLISDFSPLSRLKNLKGVRIFWNIRANKLWDMSENKSLTHLEISDCKKITQNLQNLNTGHSLKDVFLYGSMFNDYPLESLSAFANLPSLERLTLRRIKLLDKSIDFLQTVPKLAEFNFPAGMFTTEEIAYICAKYPQMHGTALCAYNKKDAILSDVRVCGYRKPGLILPKDQKRLDRYVAEFDALVEKYKNEEIGDKK